MLFNTYHCIALSWAESYRGFDVDRVSLKPDSEPSSDCGFGTNVDRSMAVEGTRTPPKCAAYTPLLFRVHPPNFSSLCTNQNAVINLIFGSNMLRPRNYLQTSTLHVHEAVPPPSQCC